MRVPATDSERHESGAGLDQPPGGEGPLTQRRPAIVVADDIRLAGQVESRANAVGVEDLQRLAMEVVQPRQRIGRLERLQATVEPALERFARLKVGRREPARQRDPMRLECPSDRLAFDLERAVRRAEIARARSGDTFTKRGESHIRRDPRLGGKTRAASEPIEGYSRAGLGRLPVAIYVVPGP